MDYLPLFANVTGRAVLLVGGGDVALRKARLLRDAGARLTVVSPDLHADLQALQAEAPDSVWWIADRFAPQHLVGQRLVIAATDDHAVNAAVAEAADAAGLWVNVVDDPAHSTFIFPSIIDRSPLVVAVSSGGAAPVLARLLRERLESLLPTYLGTLARLSGEWRGKVRQALDSLTARRRFWERAFASWLGAAAGGGGRLHGGSAGPHARSRQLGPTSARGAGPLPAGPGGHLSRMGAASGFLRLSHPGVLGPGPVGRGAGGSPPPAGGGGR